MNRAWYVALLTAVTLGMGQAWILADGPATRPQSVADPARMDLSATRPTTQPQPSPALSPADVVRIQMEALQHNDQPRPDAGIRTVFGFASPRNRTQTGPLDHFTDIVKSPQYASMIGFRSAQYSEVRFRNGLAEELVQIIDSHGNRVLYLFMLSRQTDGIYQDCWMNENVVPEGETAAPAAPAPENPVQDRT